MIKNILVYRQEAVDGPALTADLTAMGYRCVEFSDTFEDCHTDAVFVMKVMNYMQAEDIHMVLSWNYLPLLASVCEMRKLPYVSWICDCSQRTLFSKTVLYQCNYLFCFDRVYANRLAGLGCENVYHFPLAVDGKAFEEELCGEQESAAEHGNDILFVGKLHGGTDKWLESAEMPEYAKGYISGIEEAQIRVYGYNFVREMLEEETARNILKGAGISLGDMYFDSPVQLAADLVNEDITEKERRRVIEKLTPKHKLQLYTDVHFQGCVSPVFQHSKINLHVTSKSVESGIPQRVLDILACGGFCLTNYQPEIAEFFDDGVELVMYTDMTDLVQKVEYYLQHEEERKAVARAGREKVMAQFSLPDRLSDMLHIVENGMG